MTYSPNQIECGLAHVEIVLLARLPLTPRQVEERARNIVQALSSENIMLLEAFVGVCEALTPNDVHGGFDEAEKREEAASSVIGAWCRGITRGGR